PEGDYQVAEEEKNLIMHISLPIGNGSILMGSDTSKSFAPNFTKGNNFSISIDTDSKEEAEQKFEQLSKGGKIVMPMQSTFWGSYFGMLTDKFGIQWMVSYGDNGSN
ncbi:VOC family protein, partial [Fulvivirga sp. RKSG066]|uniref:VOC family protein n=1 Tax=Fulvivirga aurantia TaxID=2529383 RepID=UPI0012BD5143